MGKFHSMNVMKNGQILIFFLMRYHRAMRREIISLPPYRAVCGWTRSNRHSWFSCAPVTGFEGCTKEKGAVICCHIEYPLAFISSPSQAFFLVQRICEALYLLQKAAHGEHASAICPLSLLSV